MKEKILAALTTRYKDLGFGAKAIAEVAHYLAKKVIYEEEIDGAIQDVKGLLEVFQSDTDARVQRAVIKTKAKVQEKRTDANKNKCCNLKNMHTSKQKENQQGGEASKKETLKQKEYVDQQTTDSYQALLDALTKQCITQVTPKNKVPNNVHNITVICVEGNNYTVSVQSKKTDNETNQAIGYWKQFLRNIRIR
ncbi:hypothetical protein LZQ00_00625 [Sphingobacterium sp. SRCM116780]|uniref:hypothetical protein n=1 Tax=Sphingobacterium sp. SRCM116780 TaxID=2907623 RepID=UPI001F398124|nr:hypothetical protein [Sphingobacterium sp. SRCM116780]UIR56346.1 hypothetical protein LZQ00_00625 [Sphingobacterium sp. SRCM116780]